MIDALRPRGAPPVRPIPCLFLVLLLSGCLFSTDSNSNYRVTVMNRTNQTVSVDYFSCRESGFKTHYMEVLEPGQKADLYVCGSLPDRDFVEVTMDGRKKRYPFQADFWGNDEITVEQSDFSG